MSSLSLKMMRNSELSEHWKYSRSGKRLDLKMEDFSVIVPVTLTQALRGKAWGHGSKVVRGISKE
jgi:hypothetical protein